MPRRVVGLNVEVTTLRFRRAADASSRASSGAPECSLPCQPLVFDQDDLGTGTGTGSYNAALPAVLQMTLYESGGGPALQGDANAALFATPLRLPFWPAPPMRIVTPNSGPGAVVGAGLLGTYAATRTIAGNGAGWHAAVELYASPHYPDSYGIFLRTGASVYTAGGVYSFIAGQVPPGTDNFEPYFTYTLAPFSVEANYPSALVDDLIRWVIEEAA